MKQDTKWRLRDIEGKEYIIIDSEKVDMQEELNKMITKQMKEIERLNNIIKVKDKDFELLRRAQLKKCQEYENLEKLNNANYQSFIEVNNIINELDKFLKDKIDSWKKSNDDEIVKDTIYHERLAVRLIYDYLQELKGVDKE